jgi:hypothetical protein
MSLLNTYKAKNTDNIWFDRYSSLAKGADGRMFEYINTNFRTQESFTSQFKEFLLIENKPREEWNLQEDHGQEIDKHRVVNMVESKLFKKNVNGLCLRTQKGVLYTDFTSKNLISEEKWFLNYIFLINGYFFGQKNYIVNRVKEVLLPSLLSVDSLDLDKIKSLAKEILRVDSLESILKQRFFYLHSFYSDQDLLEECLRATDSEIEELSNYILANLSNKKYICCISKKYKPGGNFNKNMLLDEVRVFLLSVLLIQRRDLTVENFSTSILEEYIRNIAPIDGSRVMAYIRLNGKIFYPIFTEVLDLTEQDSNLNSVDLIEGAPSEDVAEDYIDETSEEGQQKIKSIFGTRKLMARIQAEYKCGLETINNCREIYFTAKANNKTYLELHHLIPQEFRNDFSYSIEVLANYVTLCPRCHRQIHLSTDRERKHLINALYEARKERLKVVRLDLDLRTIYKYYKIDF